MQDETRYRSAERAYWDSLGVRPTEEWHDLPTTGCRVRVQVVGEGAPVVFLHGANTACTVWGPLAAALNGFRCLLVDRPGCGLSSPLPRRIVDVDAFAVLAETFTAELLDAAGLGRTPMLSTSLGGYHAIRSASARPDRVSGVVQLGWTVGAPNDHLPLVMRLGGSRRVGRLMAAMPAPRAAIRPMVARIGLRQAVAAGRISDAFVEWFHAVLNRTDTMRNELDGSPPIIRFRGLNASVLFPDDVLRRIDVPVAFVWGDGDPFGDERVARALAARVPGSTLAMVPDAGHAVWFDDLETVAATVTRALSELTDADDREG